MSLTEVYCLVNRARGMEVRTHVLMVPSSECTLVVSIQAVSRSSVTREKGLAWGWLCQRLLSDFE